MLTLSIQVIESYRPWLVRVFRHFAVDRQKLIAVAKVADPSLLGGNQVKNIYGPLPQLSMP